MIENNSTSRNPLLKDISGITPISEQYRKLSTLTSLMGDVGHKIEIERTKEDSIRLLNTEVKRLNHTIDSMNAASNISVNFSLNKNNISITIFALIAAFGIFRYFSIRKHMNKKS